MTLDAALRAEHGRTAARSVIAAHRARLRRRTLAVLAGLGVLAAALVVATMTIGSYDVGPWAIVASALHLRDDPAIDFVVRELRLPTAATCVGVGIALGVAGLIFQQLLANPLASPDFVGVSSGASLFGVGAIVLFEIGSAGISAAALLGALVSATIVYLLAWRDGISGYRFVLIGIGVSEFMLALVGYMVARSEINDARAAMAWLIGSVGHAGDGQLRVLLIAVAVLVPVALLLQRPLRALELGDASATGLGVRVEAARLALIAVALVLVAVATAAAGPLMFVALVAGPVARRLLGPAGGALVAAGLVGAAIVLAADLIALHALPVALPTGVVTGAVGAPYLIALLAMTNRTGRGG